MVLLRALLFPLSIVYDLVTRIRNRLYDTGYKKAFRFETPVLTVGNLNVGGSGKTPMVEYLIRLLTAHGRVVTLSRGYGRTSKGFRVADDNDSARTVGDEPFQIFLKFKKYVTVAVGEDRAWAISQILQLDPAPQVVVLDDAFQHRRVTPQFSILLTDYGSPFYSDWLLPSGNLRESRHSAKRSNAIVVTKCPSELKDTDRQRIAQKIRRYAPSVPVFFSGIVYGVPKGFTNRRTAPLSAGDGVVLVSGVANSEALEQYVATRFALKRHFKFNDHHHYTLSELMAIQEYRSKEGRNVRIVTTEKDFVKFLTPDLLNTLDESAWFYLPMETSFVENGSEFDSMVLQSIKKTN